MERVSEFIIDNINSQSFFCFSSSIPRFSALKLFLEYPRLRTLVVLPLKQDTTHLQQWALSQGYGVASSMTTLKRNDFFKLNKILFTTQNLLINDLFGSEAPAFQRVVIYEPEHSNLQLGYLSYMIVSSKPQTLIQSISFHFSHYINKVRTCELLASMYCQSVKLLPFGDSGIQEELAEKSMNFKVITVENSSKNQKIINMLNESYLIILEKLCKNLLIPTPQDFNACYGSKSIYDHIKKNGAEITAQRDRNLLDQLRKHNQALEIFDRSDYVTFNRFIDEFNQYFPDDLLKLSLEKLYFKDRPISPLNPTIEATLFIAEHIKNNFLIACHEEEVRYLKSVNYLVQHKKSIDLAKKFITNDILADYCTFLSDKRIRFDMDKVKNELVGTTNSIFLIDKTYDSVVTFNDDIENIDFSNIKSIIMTHPDPKFMRNLYFCKEEFENIFILEQKSDCLNLNTFPLIEKELEDANFLKMIDVLKVYKARPFKERSTNGKIVVVDKREFKSNLAIELFVAGFDIHPAVLEIGDYILSKSCAVERKSVPDFLGSVSSGRLREQLFHLTSNYTMQVILIEGNEKNSLFSIHESLNNTTLYKLVSIYKTFPNVKIVYSSSPRGTVKIFDRVAESDASVIDYASDLKRTSQYEVALSQINTITRSSANAIAREIPSFKELVNLSQDEINAKVPGTGIPIHNFLHTPLRTQKRK